MICPKQYSIYLRGSIGFRDPRVQGMYINSQEIHGPIPINRLKKTIIIQTVEG